MPDSTLGWIALIAACIVCGGSALALGAFCVASMTWGMWQVAKEAWCELRPKPRTRRGFDVLPPR